MTATERTARMNSAIRRAQQLRWHERVLGSPRWGWHADSTSDQRRVYAVTPEYRCTCEAGRRGVPCVHAAACFLARHGLGGARVTVRAAA